MKILSVLVLSVVSALGLGYPVPQQPSTDPRCTARTADELYLPYGAPVPGTSETCWSLYQTKVHLSRGWYAECIVNANGRCDRIRECEERFVKAMQTHDEVYELCIQFPYPERSAEPDCPMREAWDVYPPFGAPVPGAPMSCWYTYQALIHQFEYDYLACVASIPYPRYDPRYCERLKKCEQDYISQMKAAEQWYADCISEPSGN